MSPIVPPSKLVTVHHIKRESNDHKLDAYVVKLGGVQVYRSGFLKSSTSQSKYAHDGAHNFARTLRRALDTYAANDKDRAIESLARDLLPAVIIERALARHTSEAEGAALDAMATPFEEAFIKAEKFYEQIPIERAARAEEEKDAAESERRAVSQ